MTVLSNVLPNSAITYSGGEKGDYQQTAVTMPSQPQPAAADGIQLKSMKTYDNPGFGDSNQNLEEPPNYSNLETTVAMPARVADTAPPADQYENEDYPDSDSEWESDEEPDTTGRKGLAAIQRAHNGLGSLWENHSRIFWIILGTFCLLLYGAYFGWCMWYRYGDEGSERLLWVTCVVIASLLLKVLWHFIGKRVRDGTQGCRDRIAPHTEKISWVVVGLVFAFVIIFVLVDVLYTTKEYYNLVSGCGIIFYVLLLFLCSTNPGRVQWRAVVWGLGLQFIFAMIILRWNWGFQAFNWVGDRITEFLDLSDAGASFLFGASTFRMHFFAFKVLPTIIFFSTVMSILYHIGVMQWVVRKVAWVMQAVMGTTSGESLNAAANIFVGQTEAPLVIRPLLPHMTRSELHAVMTGGFATIAGGVLAAYISFGVPANHLLSASVMSAPAALAMAKLLYPETKKSKTKADDVKGFLDEKKENNIISAASKGASLSASLVANVAVNLIAFLSLLEFVNVTLTWFGDRAGVPNLTLQFIMSYVLYPLSIVMGVEIGYDCRRVAQLIGVKTILNEFVAYDNLKDLISNRHTWENHVANNGSWLWQADDVMLLNPMPSLSNATEYRLINGFMSVRSEVIATYALCGFANIGSIGIQLGGLGAMAPKRRRALASVAVRAMMAGNVACFMTACIAGLFYQTDQKSITFTN